MSDAAIATIVAGVIQLATIVSGVAMLWIKQRAAEQKLDKGLEKIDIVRKQTDGLAKALAAESKAAGHAAGVSEEQARSPTLISSVKDAVAEVLNGGKRENGK